MCALAGGKRLCGKKLRKTRLVKEDDSMHGMMNRTAVVFRQRRRRELPRKTAVRCEVLEERSLLSAFGGPGAIGLSGSRAAEMSAFGAGRRDGLFGGGSLGLGGGMMNPTLLLSAPLLEGGSGTSTPPSPSVMSSTAVQTAFQTLQTDLKNDTPSGAQPTHASVGALEDTLDAIRKGTLTGTAAQTQIQSDQAAILASMGLTQAQITQIQSDQTALQTAISSASTTTTSGTTAATASSTSTGGTSSSVQTALQTLQTDLENDTPSGAQATHASIGAVEDDLDAIRKGTLTGAAAVTKVQTDAAAVLASMGLTAAQVTQIQTDQQAVQTAMAAISPSSTSSSSTTTTTTTSTSSTSTTSIAATESTLQSVGAYLIGIPSVSTIGTRSMDRGGWGGGFGAGFGGGFGVGFGGGFGSGPRGGF
jgi:antitoxin component of RelBE/YafQ-DinJ toxin-antitoxin module